MVIKYFGKDEYAPLEEILYQNKENNGVSSLDTSMSSLLDILDDYIVHKKILHEYECGNSFTIQQIREGFHITGDKNSWLTVWRTWDGFNDELEATHIDYTKSDLANELNDTNLILLFANRYFLSIQRNGIPRCGLEYGLSDSAYSLIDICNQIINEKYNSNVSKGIAVNAIWELVFDNTQHEDNLYDDFDCMSDENETDIDENEFSDITCIMPEYIINEHINSKKLNKKEQDMTGQEKDTTVQESDTTEQIKYTTEQIIDIFKKTNAMCQKDIQAEKKKKLAEKILVASYMTPIIAAMIKYSHKFPFLSYIENPSGINKERIPLEPNQVRFENNIPNHTKQIEWFYFFNNTLEKKAKMYESIHTDDELGRKFFEFAYWIMFGIPNSKHAVKVPKKSDKKVILTKYTGTEEICYYNIEKIFGFHFVQYVSQITYYTIFEELNKAPLPYIIESLSDMLEHDLIPNILDNKLPSDILDNKLFLNMLDSKSYLYILCDKLLSDMLDNNFKGLISEIFNSYGVYSRLRMAKKYIPEFIKETIVKRCTSFKYGSWGAKPFIIKDIKKIDNILNNAEIFFANAQKRINSTEKTNISEMLNELKITTEENLIVYEFYNNICETIIEVENNKCSCDEENTSINKSAQSAYYDYIKKYRYEISERYGMTVCEDNILSNLLYWATTAVITAKKNF